MLQLVTNSGLYSVPALKGQKVSGRTMIGVSFVHLDPGMPVMVLPDLVLPGTEWSSLFVTS